MYTNPTPCFALSRYRLLLGFLSDRRGATDLRRNQSQGRQSPLLNSFQSLLDGFCETCATTHGLGYRLSLRHRGKSFDSNYHSQDRGSSDRSPAPVQLSSLFE